MKHTPLFLRPVFQERIWGGEALRKHFGYHIPSDKTGECWAISAHPNGISIIENGVCAGQSLKKVWEENPNLFGDFPSGKFPLLIKILDANEDLSVQVHPGDSYAKQYEHNECGKTECWYIIDCSPDAEIVFGHNAKTKEELQKMIGEENWEGLLKKVKVQSGDFFYVPSGTIHALCKGILAIEIQQSSDTTYRVYDYDRRDTQGQKRELHLRKALDVATVPHIDVDQIGVTMVQTDASITRFVQNNFFSVYKWDIYGEASFIQDKVFLLISVIEGEGILQKDSQQYHIKKGKHFILPYEFGMFTIKGDLRIVVSHP